IFTIDTNGEVKLQLLSGYKSSYVDLSDLVDQMFPHITWDTVYNDWNYWKPPLPEIEIPTEIYENQPISSSPKSSVAIIGSPRLGMIRTLTGTITGSNNMNQQKKAVQSTPGMLESSGNPTSDKINENDLIIANSRIVYVGGDVDMPGRMDIYENEEGRSM
ncbi:6535_t:CDS:2, partial [Funneliformis mosseae]